MRRGRWRDRRNTRAGRRLRWRRLPLACLVGWSRRSLFLRRHRFRFWSCFDLLDGWRRWRRRAHRLRNPLGFGHAPRRPIGIGRTRRRWGRRRRRRRWFRFGLAHDSDWLWHWRRWRRRLTLGVEHATDLADPFLQGRRFRDVTAIACQHRFEGDLRLVRRLKRIRDVELQRAAQPASSIAQEKVATPCRRAAPRRPRAVPASGRGIHPLSGPGRSAARAQPRQEHWHRRARWLEAGPLTAAW